MSEVTHLFICSSDLISERNQSVHMYVRYCPNVTHLFICSSDFLLLCPSNITLNIESKFSETIFWTICAFFSACVSYKHGLQGRNRSGHYHRENGMEKGIDPETIDREYPPFLLLVPELIPKLLPIFSPPFPDRNTSPA